MLEIKDLTRTYGRKHALRGASLHADSGIVGVLGRNGAGKTTLLRILATLLKPTDGSVLFDGRDAVASPEPLRRATAYLPQDTGYPRDVSARTYVRYLLSLRGADTGRADHWLREMGLGDVATARLGSYSGGMLQRAGLAYALACDARVLLLDEPTQGLDPWERVRFHGHLAQLAAERLILFSTHIVSDVESVANRIVVLDHGAVIYDGTPDELVTGDPEPAWVLRDGRPPESMSAEYTITGLRRLPGGELESRGVGAVPTGAVRVRPTLEDRYLRLTDRCYRAEV